MCAAQNRADIMDKNEILIKMLTHSYNDEFLMKVMESICHIRKHYFFYFEDIVYFDDCMEEIVRIKSKLGLFKIVSNSNPEAIAFTRLKTDFNTEIQLSELQMLEDEV